MPKNKIKPKKIVKQLQLSYRRKRKKYQAPLGTNDIVPEDFKYHRYINYLMMILLRNFSFEQMDVPAFEQRELFVRAIGLDSEVISKKLINFRDENNEQLVLRPDLVPGIIRSYIENGMSSKSQPVKIYSSGSVFRGGKIKEDEKREFSQVQIDAIGGSKPALDAEIIQIFWELLSRLGFENVVVQINSIGCPECRREYKDMLIDFYRPNSSKLCSSCKKMLKKNPMRLLNCKEEKCLRLSNNAPQMFDNLCEVCHDHFKGILEILDELDIVHSLNPKLVRDYGYYTRTVFEIWPGDNDKFHDKILASGGRHDSLVEMLGGRSTSAVGGCLELDQVVMSMKELGIKPYELHVPSVYLAQLGELAKKKAFTIFQSLCNAGVDVYESFGRDSLRSQIKQAGKLNAKIMLILGQKEALDGSIIVRDLSTGIQEVIDQQNLISELRKRLIKDERGKGDKKDKE